MSSMLPLRARCSRTRWPISGLEAMGSAGSWWRLSRIGQALCAALRRAAVRFGAKIVQEKAFEDTGAPAAPTAA